METHTKSEPRALVKKGSRSTDSAGAPTTNGAAKPAKKKVVAGQTAALAMKAGKAARPPRSSRVGSEGKKLVCRYCGSDDLAPSFVKRCDARCRACFRQRYGSAQRNPKAKPVRQAKAAK